MSIVKRGLACGADDWKGPEIHRWIFHANLNNFTVVPNHTFFVIKFHRASCFCEYTDPKEGGNGQLGDNVSDECCREARDYNVTHVCGHYPTSIGQRGL